jgi:p-hydroxybenzoate 3-monooxygenase
MLKRMTSCDGWKPNVGSILNKNVTAMRSFVVEPMNSGRLYLAGDAAHIVPPTGANGFNLAVSDVLLLGRAISAFSCNGKTGLLETYSATALKRVWRSQGFSWWIVGPPPTRARSNRLRPEFPPEVAHPLEHHLSSCSVFTRFIW